MSEFGLDRLQKEIDALTYNARSVLNALIHSVVSAGTSQGFKAIRAGTTILLSRVDIYRIYTFYKNWEDNQFLVGANQTIPGTQRIIVGFDELLKREDAVVVRNEDGTEDTTATTNALVRHSKILFMNEINKDQELNTYWLDLIKNATNPKLVSNSSPIPINLRTPVLDPNLSTAKYNIHPTYILPYGYFNADLFGYDGDNVDHTLGGKSWTITGDDFLNLESLKVSLGSADLSAVYKTRELRTGVYSLSFGFDCSAQGDYSVAGGIHSIVPKNSLATGSSDTNETNIIGAVAIGNSNIASSDSALALAGEKLSASGRWASSIGGYNNITSAQFGAIVGGQDNTVGGKWFNFKFSTVNQEVQDSQLSETGTAQSVTDVIIYGYTTEFSINDLVMLFDFTVKGPGGSVEYFQTDGDGEKAGLYQILKVSYTEQPDDPNAYYTQLSFNKAIPRAGVINGGKVSKIYNATTMKNVGYYSFASGIGNIADGVSQAVFGSYNDRNPEAKLIVGVGTNDADDRKNVFECYEDGFACYGTPANGNEIPRDVVTVFDDSFSGMRYSENTLDVIIGRNKLRISKSHFVGPNDSSGFSFVGSLDDTNEYSILATYTDGIKLYNKISKVTLLTGDDDFTTVNSQDINLFATENVNIEAHKDFLLRAKNTGETGSTGNINISWDGTLTLTGNTHGALPTSSNQYNHNYIGEAASYSNGLIPDGAVNQGTSAMFHTGFYALDACTNPILGPSMSEEGVQEETDIDTELGIAQFGEYHLLSFGYVRANTTSFYNLQFIFGSDPTKEGHIGVRRGRSESINDTWLQENATSGLNIKKLAWYEDINYQYPTNFSEPYQYEKVQSGQWTNIDPTYLSVYYGTEGYQNEVKLSGATAGSYTYTLIPAIVNDTPMYTIALRYTIIKFTMMFEMYLMFTSVAALPEPGTQASIVMVAFTNNSSTQYNKLFKPVFITAGIYSTPSFPCTTYYRNIEIPSFQHDPYVTNPYYQRIYNCNVIKNSSNNNTQFLISKCGFDNTATSTNIFCHDFDTNLPIVFSGSYPLEQIAPFPVLDTSIFSGLTNPLSNLSSLVLRGL